MTTQEKYELNLFNGKILNRDASNDMYFLSYTRGIDEDGINQVFDWYANLLYLKKKVEFDQSLKQPRNNKGQFISWKK